MQISIVDHHQLLSPSVQQLAERRLLFALARFDSRITAVCLEVGDANGPRGGVDKVCRITVELRGLPTVRVSCEDARIESAISRAADRANRGVTRSIERNQRFDRPRLYAN